MKQASAREVTAAVGGGARREGRAVRATELGLWRKRTSWGLTAGLTVSGVSTSAGGESGRRGGRREDSAVRRCWRLPRRCGQRGGAAPPVTPPPCGGAASAEGQRRPLRPRHAPLAARPRSPLGGPRWRWYEGHWGGASRPLPGSCHLRGGEGHTVTVERRRARAVEAEG